MWVMYHVTGGLDLFSPVEGTKQNRALGESSLPKAVVLTWWGYQMCLPGGTCPFPALADVLRDLSSGHTQGKIVLVPSVLMKGNGYEKVADYGGVFGIRASPGRASGYQW